MSTFSQHINELAARQITPSPHYTGTSDARARVWRPFPATVPSPPNTCFFARPDSAIGPTLLYQDKTCPFIRTLPSRQLYYYIKNPDEIIHILLIGFAKTILCQLMMRYNTFYYQVLQSKND
jgi:hypothetical protein